jgi:rubrerythrin
MTTLKKGLIQVFENESQAYIKCLAFAKKAESEGYNQIARLFRTVAETERILAQHHLRAMEEVGATRDNMQEVLNEDVDSNENKYLSLIEEAKAEGNTWATKSLCYAHEDRKIIKKLFKRALEDIGRNKEVDCYLCKACGFIVENEVPEKCPVCGSRKETFKIII